MSNNNKASAEGMRSLFHYDGLMDIRTDGDVCSDIHRVNSWMVSSPYPWVKVVGFFIHKGHEILCHLHVFGEDFEFVIPCDELMEELVNWLADVIYHEDGEDRSDDYDREKFKRDLLPRMEK